MTSRYQKCGVCCNICKGIVPEAGINPEKESCLLVPVSYDSLCPLPKLGQDGRRGHGGEQTHIFAHRVELFRLRFAEAARQVRFEDRGLRGHPRLIGERNEFCIDLVRGPPPRELALIRLDGLCNKVCSAPSTYLIVARMPSMQLHDGKHVSTGSCRTTRYLCGYNSAKTSVRVYQVLDFN